jgi:hypothetical protein
VEGFRPNTKMKSQIACFKEGGSTTPAKRESKRHEKADVAEDKKIVKKAVAQHEGAKHKGEEKTELKLKSGGRAKKDKPSVKRFDSKAIKMKKDDSDKKAIAKVKKTKPVVERMSPAPAAPAPEGMGMGMEDTQDMGVEGYAAGRGVGGMPAPEMAGMEAYMPPAGAPSAAMRRGMRPAQMPMLGGGASGAVPMPSAMGQGAMGAAPMPSVTGMGGAMSDRERAILQGLQAVGNYCGGGKAY